MPVLIASVSREFPGNRGDEGFAAFQAEMNFGIDCTDNDLADGAGKLIACACFHDESPDVD